MFQQLQASPPDVRSAGGPTTRSSQSRVRQRKIFDCPVTDAEAPLFAELRASLGLPSEARWWSTTPVAGRARRLPYDLLTVERVDRAGTPGRHVAVLSDGELVVTSSPTLELLERTLAGLRSWTPRS